MLKAIPENYKLVIDNPFVRVLEAHIPAGTEEKPHRHLRGVSVCMTEYTLESRTLFAATPPAFPLPWGIHVPANPSATVQADLDKLKADRTALQNTIKTDQTAIDKFLHSCRAGCLNVNAGTAGASSKLPFGGLGHSGNHRPAGAFSLDYCAFPVAHMFEDAAAATVAPGMRIEDEWVR